MTENAVRFLAKNELGHFSTARFWPGPSLDWRSPHWHLMGFLCYSSLDKMKVAIKLLQARSFLDQWGSGLMEARPDWGFGMSGSWLDKSLV